MFEAAGVEAGDWQGGQGCRGGRETTGFEREREGRECLIMRRRVGARIGIAVKDGKRMDDQNRREGMTFVYTDLWREGQLGGGRREDLR